VLQAAIRARTQRAVPSIKCQVSAIAGRCLKSGAHRPNFRGSTATIAGVLWREKVAQTDPSGENAPRYIFSDRPMTEEEWERERCGE
jgi:hypothetical protein